MSRTCSCGPAFTPPGTLRPRQCGHLVAGLGRSAEAPGPPAGPGRGPPWRESLSESAVLLTAQLLASAALAATLSPQIILAPRAPHQPLQQLPAHVPRARWPLLPGQYLSGCIPDPFFPSQNHPKMETTVQGEKGGNGGPKGCRGCLRRPPTPSLPPKPMQTTSFRQEKGKSQVPLKTRWKNK